MTTVPEKYVSSHPVASYVPLDFALVRAPLLPIEMYRRLTNLAGSRDDSSALIASLLNGCQPGGKHSLIHQALAIGSASFWSALHRRPTTRRAGDKLNSRLLRYLIRMATRPTPYGTFAGVALARWGNCTDLGLERSCGHVRTRPDMAWLYAFVWELESQRDIRRQLSLTTNSAVVIRAGRVFLAERAPTNAPGPNMEVSVKATGVVLRALEAARQPVKYCDLADSLLKSSPSANTAKTDKLLFELIQQTFLISDLRPPLTEINPVEYVLKKLRDINSASAVCSELESLIAAAHAWELGSDDDGSGYVDLVSRAKKLSNRTEDPIFQVDMALSLRGTQLSRKIADEAARAAELLLSLSPVPTGIPGMREYRRAFEARYGGHREVMLAELLHPTFGLGPPPSYNHSSALDQHRAAVRARALSDLALEAIRERKLVIELDKQTIKRLETWSPTNEFAPTSIELYASVAATSAAAVDSGQFHLVIGPNLGATGAGRNLGRFADLLGAAARKELEKIACAEQSRAPEKIFVELTYLPCELRSANVVIRPLVRSHEIALGTTAGATDDKTIRLNDLAVGIRDDRFYVRWIERNVEIIACAGHMLNNIRAPALCRFLLDVAREAQANLSSFDWGSASGFPFLPRVQTGRSVLRLAEWRLSQQSMTGQTTMFLEWLSRWREKWQVPQHVYLSVGDNRLLLNLDDEAQVAQLQEELTRGDGRIVTLQEVFPSLDEMWVEGKDGHYVSELVIPLVLDTPAQNETKKHPRNQTLTSKRNGRLAGRAKVGEEVRLRLPGSDWLFAKIYCPENLEDDLIAFHLFSFAESAISSELARSWFFVRYSDPAPHLRIRFSGEPKVLSLRLMPLLISWAERLVKDGLCTRLAFDTYDREVERYGGIRGIDYAESIFASDSRAIAQLLALVQSRALEFDTLTLATLSVDNLLRSFDLSLRSRANWCQDFASRAKEAAHEYRYRKALLRSLLGRPGYLLAQFGGQNMTTILSGLRREIESSALSLSNASEREELTQPLEVLYASFVHMHLNRLVGRDTSMEKQVVGVLSRTLEGLACAPLNNPLSSITDGLDS